MTVTAVDICNAALRKIGSRDIAAISDVTPGGAIAGDVLTFERDAELRAHVWNFAVTRVRLGLLRVVPRFEFDFAYGVPSDWLRTISVFDNDAGDGQAIYKMEQALTSELVLNGGFDDTSVWTPGAGWAVSSGKGRKTAGSASDLSQTVATVAGTYRIAFLVEGMSAGTLTAKLTGGTPVTGTARSVNGYYVEEFTTTGGNTGFALSASSTFNGTVDDVTCTQIDGAAVPAIVTDSDTLWLKYVRRVTNYDQMPPSFQQVLILRMARVFAIGLANSNTNYQLLDQELKETLRMARSVDGMEDFPDPFPDGSWVNSRGGSASQWDWTIR